ncbi:hypothetical protein DMI62_02235 [Escherichia coli]|nr:hypothetical protein [Escherichia coli]
MIVMKRVITLFAVLLMGWSVNARSFACKTANGTAIPIGGGSANVYVNLAPAVNVGQNRSWIFRRKSFAITITRKPLQIMSHCNEARLMAACYLIFPGP